MIPSQDSPRRANTPSTEVSGGLRYGNSSNIRGLKETGTEVPKYSGAGWRDIDLAEREIRVIGKGSKERVVVFPERTQALLKEFAGGRDPGDWLFSGYGCHHGHVRDQKTLQGILHRVGEETGLPYRLTAHLLRHGWFKLMKISPGFPLKSRPGSADITIFARPLTSTPGHVETLPRAANEKRWNGITWGG